MIYRYVAAGSAFVFIVSTAYAIYRWYKIHQDRSDTALKKKIVEMVNDDKDTTQILNDLKKEGYDRERIKKTINDLLN